MQSSKQNICSQEYNLKQWEIRLSVVSEELEKMQVKRVFDLGCGSGSFIQRLSRNPLFEQLVGVDIDHHLLTTTTVQKVSPEMLQESIQYSRDEPLTVSIYNADILKRNAQLRKLVVEGNNPCAVTLIEVIEHIPPEKIELMTENVFGFLRPQYVLITTPNREFNVNFQRMVKFRHKDHKFEWSRAEFRSFCVKVKATYGYNYSLLSMMGEETQKHPGTGPCSQGVVFILNKHEIRTEPNPEEELMLRVAHIKYPFWRDNIQNAVVQSIEEKLSMWAKSMQVSNCERDIPKYGFSPVDLINSDQRMLLALQKISVADVLDWAANSRYVRIVDNVIYYNEVEPEYNYDDEEMEVEPQVEEGVRGSEC